MNNEQFRRLIQDGNRAASGSSASQATPRDASAGGATPGPGMALGSRMRSSIPMTPRSVTGVNFARQLAEHRRETQQPPTKRFRSSAAPKGTKLPSGYQDRAQLRQQESGDKDVHEDGNLAQRIAALEELVKKGDIDQATFDKLRVEMGVGGDVSEERRIHKFDTGFH